MGVFKWLRRERVTVTTSQINPTLSEENVSTHMGTIRTEEYKTALAEFQARRPELQDTPKKRCGRHSLPISCTDCTGDPDTTFNYEKKSAIKYKKKHERRSTQSEERFEGVPNVQFLFQHQVFMPGNLCRRTAHSEPKRSSRRKFSSPEFLIQKQIEFDDDQPTSPPFIYKNNSLPFDVTNFLDTKSEVEEVDGASGSTDKTECSNESNRNYRDKWWEVMSELKNLDQWADEQLQSSSASTRTDDTKSDASVFGLPIASSCNIDVGFDKSKCWAHGRWGVVPVQIKRLQGVTIDNVRKKLNMEINILRKCRHPNVILLMGVYPDAQNNVHIICERCIDTLYGILHVQNRILSVQTSVHYALDIANALVYLRMHGFIHTELNSAAIMLTLHDTAKLADLSACGKLARVRERRKNYDMYSPETQYANIDATRTPKSSESEPLLSSRSSEYPKECIHKEYRIYSNSEHYMWQAPELFEPDDAGLVHPCSRSDVYSLCIVLWECCNAAVPWKSLSYKDVKEAYTLWKGGILLAQDGTYPGCLLSVLRDGLGLVREQRPDVTTLQTTLLNTKNNLDKMEYILIPSRISKKQSDFSSQAWDSSPTDSECTSPKNMDHKAIIHNSSGSETKTSSPVYETIRKSKYPLPYDHVDKCFLSDEEVNENTINKYNECSSACSTPIAKFRERIKDVTPSALHRSDSTEYCSILSPDRRFDSKDISYKDQSSERPVAKLSRSFTPKSYQPLHIKVPECNLDSFRDVIKDQSVSERSSYNFDIKNYSLPSTPIARSNKLRKHAWLSGDVLAKEKSLDKIKNICSRFDTKNVAKDNAEVADQTMIDKERQNSEKEIFADENPIETSESGDTARDSYTGLKRISDPPHDFSSPETEEPRHTMTWSLRSSSSAKYKLEDELLANVNVKPLVAIHERWICEAGRTERSQSLPDSHARKMGIAVKPASHCVDTIQRSLPQLYFKPSAKPHRVPPASPATSVHTFKHGSCWEQYNNAREMMSKTLTLRDIELESIRKDADKSTITDDILGRKQKVDQSTDTRSIEEFIRDLIRKELQHLAQENSETASEASRKTDDLVNKVASVLENLNGEEKRTPLKSFSKVKINGNNKPLLQITFSRSGENSLQVLDNCVNVTISDSGKDKLNMSVEDAAADEVHVNALKRCQAFNAIQEAKSTEDLYIDDDLSTHMQENFGGKVKIIPLHGSLHEILCEKEDDCCLIKVKQENGCDSLYFRCDNSDAESRDALDGHAHTHTNAHRDTVVYKRISLLEERVQRIYPTNKRQNPVTALKKLSDKLKCRPKSEVFLQNINQETRALSSSSPSLLTNDREVEVNIENVMSYQDSSSDECIKCEDYDDFEIIEREIEEDVANGNYTMNCGCLEKISEENLSVLNEDVDKS